MKIDSHQVPKPYFEYLIWKLGVHVNSVRQVCHKAQPCYQGATLRISYKLFQLDPFLDALEEQDLVPFNEKRLFASNEICEESPTSLSAEDEIARAKEQAHAPTGRKRKRLSSKSLLTVEYGEGRATREVEIIWWPNLYTFTEHGQMIIRMYIEKCDF